MRIVFMGTPDFAVPTFDALLAAGHELVAVYCQPPRPAGRGKALRESPIQARAEAAGIAARTPLNLRDGKTRQEFAALDADVAVVAAYGLILPPSVLEAPRHGCLNVHASLLPRWRGAAPIQRAILAGDDKTGVTIMNMEEGLDTGPMLAVSETDIDAKTAGELTGELALMGARLMVTVLADLQQIEPRPQPSEGVTYAAKIEKHEALLDFGQPAAAVDRQIRAFNPSPGAFFEMEGERVKLLAADVVEGTGAPGTILDRQMTIACGEAAIAPRLLQRAGRAAMSVDDFLRGFGVAPGTSLA